MKKSLLLTTLVLVVALVGACGGGNDDADERRGSLSQSAGANKPDTVPAGQTVNKVTEHQSRNGADCRATFNAAWADESKKLSEVAKKSKKIVEAEVLEVRAAEDLVIPAKGEPNDEYRVPTMAVDVKVVKGHKGAAEGETLTLFQTGSPCQTVDGDPAYVKGEKHLLLLTDGPRNQLRTVAPDARFKEAEDGSLQPSHPGPVADEVKGKKVKDVEQSFKG